MMATTPFRIPKKTQTSEQDSVQMLSPLSPRVQDDSTFKRSNWGPSNGSLADRSGPLRGLGSRAECFSGPWKPALREVLKAAQSPANRTSGGQTPGHSQWKPPRLLRSWETSPPYQSGFNGTPRGNTSDGPVQRKPAQLGMPKPHPGPSPSTSTSSCFSNGRRPKRASDKLGQDENQESSCLSPQRKSHRAGPNDPAAVQASPSDPEQDSAGELSPEKASPCWPTSLGDAPWRNHDPETRGSLAQNAEKGKRCLEAATSSSVQNGLSRVSSVSTVTSRASSPPVSVSLRSDDDPPRQATPWPLPRPLRNHASSTTGQSQRQRRPFLSRVPLTRTLPALEDGPIQREREGGRSRLSLRRRPRPKQASSEPIILSSEDEDGQEVEGDTSPSLSATSRTRLGHSSPRQNQAGSEEQVEVEDAESPKQADGSPQQQPAIMELPFVTLQAGVLRAEANGVVTVTDDGITLPLKDPGSEEEGEGISVMLVASQLRGFGLWDGELAREGTLLWDWEGPAPSLLFLWVSDAQAGLVQTELSAICPITDPGRACVFLLLVLREALSDLQAGLLTSMLDVEAFLQGRSTYPPSPLSLTQGRALIQGRPPVEQMLALLGPSAPTSTRPEHTAGKEVSAAPRAGLRSREPARQLRLPSRLVYPSPSSKGGITVTTEDLACLDSGEFLNDIIIDFYLKYLLRERAASQVAERCHVFSSFFFRQLTRHAPAEDASILPRDRRHQRVKTWTRHVDIFSKDFLFVPVNQKAHWYLVVICFPGLEEAQHHPRIAPATTPGPGPRRKLDALDEERPSPDSGQPGGAAGGGGAVRGKPGESSLRSLSSRGSSNNTPDCTEHGCRRETVCRRPCILSMDSLKLSYHDNIFQLLRDYLQVEWSVRRGTPRRFTSDTMRSSNCRVPLQDNSSDCGLYLLQYVETFLQNPVVHFDDLPLRLERWFPRQQVWRKREDLQRLIMQLHDRQSNGGETGGR